MDRYQSGGVQGREIEDIVKDGEYIHSHAYLSAE
jgi:hypothetical protein